MNHFGANSSPNSAKHKHHVHQREEEEDCILYYYFTCGLYCYGNDNLDHNYIEDLKQARSGEKVKRSDQYEVFVTQFMLIEALLICMLLDYRVTNCSRN